MGINNPVPRTKILANFIKPNQMLGQDQVIPPEVLQNAKGLAVITVLKAGFLFSGRAGSGVIVARLPDGSWSPPSAIVTAGAGAGGQIGFELTDFVFILNTKEAVNSFAQAGSITLGGNVSLAAGPLGRNAEAAGTASLKSAAAIFAYSKTKGLFAGVSLEGSAIIERREANRKFYGNNCKARQILSGQVEAPPECDSLFRVLESRAFTKRRNFDAGEDTDDYYGDIPDLNSSYDSDLDDGASNYYRRNRAAASNGRASNRRSSYDDYSDEDDDDAYYRNTRDSSRFTPPKSNKQSSSSNSNSNSRTHKSGSNWEDDVFDRYDSRRSNDVDDLNNSFSKTKISSAASASYRNPPTPQSQARSSAGQGKAIALFSFEGEESGDLPFRKGEVITIIKKSESQDDWWTGRCNGKEGIFPANYVELA
ncbi:hypothetical protein WICPIJ_002058 [Wickerhamomyces pijperi]|uniref:SH3 domain-containing protein n=1 Tax=Wickerhamomyces pijperi TaxID=599730 RepID=A0A9P8TQ59_WICPI|nr:hypothetical protein WICPIJ_002058 [Wickerhamomyces pijperi]